MTAIRFEQPAIPLPLPKVPLRAGPVRDRLDALCRCAAGCNETFADERALLAHRPSGRCLTPRQAGLIRHDQPQPCWARKETP